MAHREGATGPLRPDTLAAMRIPHGRLYGADIWDLGLFIIVAAAAAILVRRRRTTGT